jgi:hypothetical protein
MANANELKKIVNRLQRVAADNETVYGHLDGRAEHHGYLGRFHAKPIHPTQPPYDTEAVSRKKAADVIEKIADHTAVFLTYLGGTPANNASSGATDDADLLRLIRDWGIVHAGALKTIVQLYRRQPAPDPASPNPGPATDQELWAEMVSWFEKMAADTDSFKTAQEFQDPSGPTGQGTDLDRLEQGVRRATLNTLQIAGLLPYHLYHAHQP